MRKTMLNEKHSERRPTMRAKIMRSSAALLFLGTIMSYSGPAQAEPPINPEKCKGAIPIGADNCTGFVFCTNDGDFMCCHANKEGGKDCEQIEAKTIKPGGVRVPVGPLQNAPMTPAPPKTLTPKAPTTGGTNKQ